MAPDYCVIFVLLSIKLTELLEWIGKCRMSANISTATNRVRGMFVCFKVFSFS